MKEIAKEIARKLNQFRAPVIFLIPLKGWLSLDREGIPLYDPEADKAFLQELKIQLDPKISIIELDLHLNTRELSQEAVKFFLDLYDKARNRMKKNLSI